MTAGWITLLSSLAAGGVLLLRWWLKTGSKKWRINRDRKKLKAMDDGVDDNDDNAVDSGLDDLGL